VVYTHSGRKAADHIHVRATEAFVARSFKNGPPH
jgi:hypothetical protein